MFFMAKNSNRGFGAMDKEQQREIASKGGQNSGGGRSSQGGSSERGLASADKETRERVAREGGKASHGGGR
jgi:general stress protein YciG